MKFRTEKYKTNAQNLQEGGDKNSSKVREKKKKERKKRVRPRLNVDNINSR